MNDNNIRQKFLATLLQPGDDRHSHFYTEYRAMLEERLNKFERREHFGRRLMAAMWITCGVLFLAGVALQISMQLRPFGMLLIMLALLGSGLSLLRTICWYLFDRRRVEDVRQERRDSLLMELERRVSDLSRKLEQQS